MQTVQHTSHTVTLSPLSMHSMACVLSVDKFVCDKNIIKPEKTADTVCIVVYKLYVMYFPNMVFVSEGFPAWKYI